MMLYRIPVMLLTIIAIFFHIGQASYSSDDFNAIKPELISSGPEFAIYQFSGFVKGRLVESVIRSGVVLVYINLGSGEMKWLISTGEYSNPTRRISYSVNRLVGMTQNRDYLLVVIYKSGWIFTPDNRPPLDPCPKKGLYTFQVFSKNEGREIYRWDFTDPSIFPEAVPVETTQEGIIKATARGYIVFDSVFSPSEKGGVQRKKCKE